MLFKKGFLFYALFNIRLFFFLLFHKFDLLVSNDLDTLLPNFLVSKLKRLPLVYDSHEYFTGVPELQNRRFVRDVWRSIEKAIFPSLKYVMTVSDSIADQYKSEYGLIPLVVRNCAKISDKIIPFTRKEIDIHPGHLLLILQGTGINIDRGGKELIDAINLTENVSLLIVGAGDQFGFLEKKVSDMNLSERIKLIPKCSWETLMKYTRSADAGISLDKNSNLNYLFSLPNKLFDYLSAGIPVIATDLPEIAKILKENDCGITISRPVPEEIRKAIIALRDNRKLLSNLKLNSVMASKSINWETESLKVKELYTLVLSDIKQHY